MWSIVQWVPQRLLAHFYTLVLVLYYSRRQSSLRDLDVGYLSTFYTGSLRHSRPFPVSNTPITQVSVLSRRLTTSSRSCRLRRDVDQCSDWLRNIAIESSVC